MTGDRERVTLYERYQRDEVLQLFGAGNTARVLCDGQWVILPHAVLCFAELGPGPEKSHFDKSGWFVWVAERPYEVSDDGTIRAIPPEAQGHRNALPIHLFVRKTGEKMFMYLGQLEPSYRMELPRPGIHYGAAQMRLSPALPSDVWARLGGPVLQEDAAAAAALDRAFTTLASNPTTETRLELVRLLQEYWLGPWQPEDVYTEDELGDLPLPAPLRWWYLHYGRRMAASDEMWVPPHKLEVERDSKIPFVSESQGLWQCATTAGEDPRVWVRERFEDDTRWVLDNEPLSGLLLKACFLGFGIAPFGPYGACASSVDLRTVERLVSVVPPVGLRAGFSPTWGPRSRTSYFAGGGVFMTISTPAARGAKPDYFVYLTAKTEHPLQFLHSLEDVEWIPEMTAF